MASSATQSSLSFVNPLLASSLLLTLFLPPSTATNVVVPDNKQTQINQPPPDSVPHNDNSYDHESGQLAPSATNTAHGKPGNNYRRGIDFSRRSQGASDTTSRGGAAPASREKYKIGDVQLQGISGSRFVVNGNYFENVNIKKRIRNRARSSSKSGDNIGRRDKKDEL